MDPRHSISSTQALAAVAVAGAALCVVALLGPAAYQAGASDLRGERGWSTTPAVAAEARAAQSARLSNYAWIDRPNGVVSLPIERAMELTAEELSRATRDAETAR